MKIGISSWGYPAKRNIWEKIPDAEYIVLKKNNNLYHTLSTIKKILTGRKINFSGKYFFYNRTDVDIVHLYNDINYSPKKWVTSFETLVPRFKETKNDHQQPEPKHLKNNKTKRALEQIAKKNCLGIISISYASANIQKELLKYYPGLEKKVLDKLHILHPPQNIITDKIKNPAEVLSFIFIGTQFHIKGGAEMVEAFKQLSQKYQFTLTIISSFKTDNYVTKISEQEAEQCREELTHYPWIKIYNNLPNEKVLELIQNSDVGLLPTWSDTYGFSVLEMQACGVPVITTDVRALPEINNQACGWMIHLPQNRLKQGLYFTAQQRETLKKTLTEQLIAILENIITDPAQITSKAEKSLERIRKVHDPAEFAKKLNKIYSSK